MAGQKENVLVTGGAGFIGSHLVERLAREGRRVAVLDNLSTGSMRNLSHAVHAGMPPERLYHMDILDADFADAVAHLNPDVIVNLAAQGQVSASMRAPVLDLLPNILGTVRVLEAAISCGVPRVVLASSGGTVYGEGSRREGLTKESDDKIPVSFYGLSKRTADEYARLYCEHFGLECISLALGNVYGSRQDPHGESGVLSIFAHLLASGVRCTITGDGSAVRDFVHVADVVEAFVRAIDKGTGLVNVGTGIGTSVLEAYWLMADRAAVDMPPLFASGKPGEVDRIVLDNSRARRELGWRPTVSLAAGVDDLMASVRAERERAEAVPGGLKSSSPRLANIPPTGHRVRVASATGGEGAASQSATRFRGLAEGRS